ncbi:MAG TPA: EFR1 family ferrodoxin [Thermotogota bacterium]|nr:EFR1 family ferrodoxin [Thermotogota bacterium]
MERIEVYFFSGTGNSLFVAAQIANGLGVPVVPLASFQGKGTIPSIARKLVIVFPVYDFKAPPIVVDFVSRFPDLASREIFAVCTYGITPFHTLKKLDGVLREKGASLRGGFSVRMPHNAVGSSLFSQEQYRGMFEAWEQKRPRVVQRIKEGSAGRFEDDSLFSFLGKFFSGGILFRMVPVVSRMLTQALFHGWDSLAFQVDGNCNGCALCQRVCPVQNIEMVDGKPRFLDHCASCFACVQWCPQHAIGFGTLDLNVKPYHHPGVMVGEQGMKMRTSLEGN